MQSLADDNPSVRHQYINLTILIIIAIDFVAENDQYCSPKRVFPLYCFSFLSGLGQQAETVDIRTCDQSVPKAYPDKGTSPLIDYLIIIFTYSLSAEMIFHKCTC